MMLVRPMGMCLSLAVVLSSSAPALAHGLAGKRFFPATLVVDDPFVADELSLPSILHIKRPAEGEESAAVETETSVEFSKRITPRLGLGFESELVHVNPDHGSTETGFGNLEVALRYELFTHAAHEAIVSLAFGWEIGGTGSKSVGAESFSVLKPALLFGKGLGDLPEGLAWLRPLAVTGLVSGEIPTRSKTKTATAEDDVVEAEIERNPDVLHWGFAIEYSIPYLQSFVRDVGLPGPIRGMIPVVELDFETFLDRGLGGKTNGTVNPGIIWAGRAFQVAVEAVVPINDRTGQNVGVRAMLHFFLDDLFPHSLGRPLLGQ